MSSNVPWRSRIIGTDLVDPQALAPNVANFRLHDDEQVALMRDVLASLGWLDELLVNRTTGRLVDGHLRLALALREGLAAVPVEYVELSDDEEAVVLALFDEIASMADEDEARLRSLIDQVRADTLALDDYFATVRARISPPVTNLHTAGAFIAEVPPPLSPPTPSPSENSRVGDSLAAERGAHLPASVAPPAVTSREVRFQYGEADYARVLDRLHILTQRYGGDNLSAAAHRAVQEVLAHRSVPSA